MKSEKKVLVVASGGLDSTVLLWMCVKEHEKVGVLTFNYGSNHNEMEHKCLEKTCLALGVPLHTIMLDFMKTSFKSSLLGQGDIPEGNYDEMSMKNTVVPFRNGILLAIAAGYAESNGYDIIALGNHAGDHTIYPDCRPEFIRSMGDAIKSGTWNGVDILSPFCDITKAQIVEVGKKIGVDFSTTYSCYKGGERHCGKCGTCRERIEAFQLAGVEDPTIYEDKN